MEYNKLKISMLILILLTFSACKEIEMTTSVNIDGSIDRLIEIRSDEALDKFSDLPMPVDSTWSFTEDIDSTKEKKYIYQFQKHFNNADEINEEYKSKDNAMSRFERKVTMKKKFRFFYTYFEYNEDYIKLVKGDYDSFAGYLSEDEQMIRAYDEKDSLEIQFDLDSAEITQLRQSVEKKFEDWFEQAMLDEIILNIKLDMKDFKVTSVKEFEIDAQRDTILSYIDSVDIDDLQQKVYAFLNKLTDSKTFEKLIEAKQTRLSKLEDDITYVLNLMDFKYNLNMPGILLDSNADMIKGNSMSWDIDPIELYFSNKSCYAESRIVNTWAFIVSGIFVLFTLFILIWGAFKNRRKLEKLRYF